jgi:Protein of unknown function (DUF4236)
MGLRFHRRLALLPGLHANLSRSGLSLSVGHRGAWYTVGPRGQRRVTVGLPGTGLSYTEQHPLPPVHGGHRLAFAAVVVVIVAAVLWMAHG